MNWGYKIGEGLIFHYEIFEKNEYSLIKLATWELLHDCDRMAMYLVWQFTSSYN